MNAATVSCLGVTALAECVAKPRPEYKLCKAETNQTVVWPGQDPLPACSLACAIALAGDENFHRARWGIGPGSSDAASDDKGRSS